MLDILRSDSEFGFNDETQRGLIIRDASIPVMSLGILENLCKKYVQAQAPSLVYRIRKGSGLFSYVQIRWTRDDDYFELLVPHICGEAVPLYDKKCDFVGESTPWFMPYCVRKYENERDFTTQSRRVDDSLMNIKNKQLSSGYFGFLSKGSIGKFKIVCYEIIEEGLGILNLMVYDDELSKVFVCIYGLSGVLYNIFPECDKANFDVITRVLRGVFDRIILGTKKFFYTK
jgi:hypothetical protein